MTRTTTTLTPALMRQYEKRARTLRSRFVFALFGLHSAGDDNGKPVHAFTAVNDAGGEIDQGGKLAA